MSPCPKIKKQDVQTESGNVSFSFSIFLLDPNFSLQISFKMSQITGT